MYKNMEQQIIKQYFNFNKNNFNTLFSFTKMKDIILQPKQSDKKYKSEIFLNVP